MNVQIFKVNSFTDKNKTYYVKLKDGKFTCNCPHFLMREKQITTDKHIDQVKRQQQEREGY